jgi:hypothetical protein
MTQHPSALRRVLSRIYGRARRAYAGFITREFHKLPPQPGSGMYGEPFRFCADGLATIHNCDFLHDPRFAAAYRTGESTGSWKGWPLQWRAHVLCCAAEHAARLPGDFVECGVNRGGNARMIIEYLRPSSSFETHRTVDTGREAFASRKFYLLDTFAGFAEQYLSEAEKRGVANYYRYSDCLADVRQTFAPFPFVEIVPGPVPDTLAKVAAERIAFLSIDMNCVAPEIAAAEFFWPKLVPGALIVLDDYGQSRHYDQKIAFDRFAQAKGVPVFSLPTSQGLIIKP